MILREKAETSIVISLFRNFYAWSRHREQRLIDIHHNSQIYRLTKEFWEKMKTCFRYSFFGRITEPRQKTSGIFETSLVVQSLFNLYKKCKHQIIQLFKASSTYHQVKDTKINLAFTPIRMMSLIVIVAITTNIALSLIVQKNISLWGWLARGLFLSLAVIGLYCRADWRSVKMSSLFMRKMRLDGEGMNKG
jgi:hypothetical protein